MYDNSHIKVTMCGFVRSAIIGLVLGGGANMSLVKNSSENPSIRVYGPLKDLA